MDCNPVTSSGPLVCHAVRLHRGDDLMESVKALCASRHISAGVILSGVGCLLRVRIRDASGVTIREFSGHHEIVSLTGTVSEERCHIHISLSREDLSTVGGHLCPGCIVNTTCELVIGELPGMRFGKAPDPETGYHELTIEHL